MGAGRRPAVAAGIRTRLPLNCCHANQDKVWVENPDGDGTSREGRTLVRRDAPAGSSSVMAVSVRFVGSGDSFGSGGRFQTCIVVDGPGSRFAIDFGASSLIALAQQGIEHNSLDAILLTHLHGDHCGGVPFLLIDAMLAAKRTRPLTIAGPRDLRRRMDQIREALFPGSQVMTPKFPLTWVEMEPGKPHSVLDLVVTPRPARHTAETNPTALRVEVGGKVIAYTGDTEWTEDVARVAQGADLFIAECYFYDKPVKWHLNYPTVAARRDRFGAKRVILTHMSKEMLAHADAVPEECARDGLVVTL
jgi:ribonuclease BN (tRNA processing enzyme)